MATKRSKRIDPNAAFAAIVGSAATPVDPVYAEPVPESAPRPGVRPPAAESAAQEAIAHNIEQTSAPLPNRQESPRAAETDYAAAQGLEGGLQSLGAEVSLEGPAPSGDFIQDGAATQPTPTAPASPNGSRSQGAGADNPPPGDSIRGGTAAPSPAPFDEDAACTVVSGDAIDAIGADVMDNDPPSTPKLGARPPAAESAAQEAILGDLQRAGAAIPNRQEDPQAAAYDLSTAQHGAAQGAPQGGAGGQAVQGAPAVFGLQPEGAGARPSDGGEIAQPTPGAARPYGGETSSASLLRNDPATPSSPGGSRSLSAGTDTHPSGGGFAAPSPAPRLVQKGYYITEEQHKRLGMYAVMQDTDRSAIVRKALDMYFEANKPL